MVLARSLPKTLCCLALALVLAALPAPPRAEASPAPLLGSAGPWITDATGRVVIVHGVNVVSKAAPWYPAAAGFGLDDAEFLAAHGFNAVRLGFAWSQVEPQPGVYDEDYIARIKQTEQVLASVGIHSLLDSHQDLYTTKVSGDWNGFPSWAALDDGLPVQPAPGFPFTYLLGPAENAAWTHLWNDSAAPDGTGLQEHYAEMWRHVAKAFAGEPYVLGYDLINEPWPGARYPTCGPPAGCPAFERSQLSRMQAKAMRAIRAVDPDHLLFYEPAVTNQAGGRVWVPNPTGDARAGMSFHVYCLLVAAPSNQQACNATEGLELGNGLRRADANDDPALVTEFGATTDPGVLDRMTQRLDRREVSWMFWSYGENLVRDMHQPPEGNNVYGDALAALVRPLPERIAGTPRSLAYDRTTRRFGLTFATERADGAGAFAPGALSLIAVPPSLYPGGYAVEAAGARVVSPPDADTLRLRSAPGASRIAVTISPR